MIIHDQMDINLVMFWTTNLVIRLKVTSTLWIGKGKGVSVM